MGVTEAAPVLGDWHIKMSSGKHPCLWGRILNAGVIGLALATFLPLFGQISPLLELFSHFKVHYVLASLVFVLLAIKMRRHLIAIAAVILMGMNGAAVIPYFTIASVIADTPQIKLINLNLRKTNPAPDKAIDFLRREDADIVVLEEITPQWAKRLKALEDVYPHMLFCDDIATCDLALLSKKSWQSGIIRELPKVGPNVIIAKFDWKGSPFTLVGTHLDPPTPAIGEDHEHFHSAQAKKISALLRSIEGPLVVAGDFNATPWSPSFNRIIEGTELARVDGGLLPTWPSQLSAIGIPIDQILTTSEFGGSTMTVGPNVISDHFPLIATLRVRG